MLEPGDVLHVPTRPTTIWVEGAVNNHVVMMWEPKARLKEYIARAGGYQRFADRNRITVVKADGTAESRGRRPHRCFVAHIPEPGDTIWVPYNFEPPKTSRWIKVQNLSKILGNLALTALAIESASR